MFENRSRIGGENRARIGFLEMGCTVRDGLPSLERALKMTPFIEFIWVFQRSYDCHRELTIGKNQQKATKIARACIRIGTSVPSGSPTQAH